MRYDKVLILTPPFYSHFNPLLSLALGFHAAGSEVIVAAAEPFMADVQAAGLRAARLDINRNANTGVAQQTQQARPESERLAAFFQATREGPIATLRLQSEHRQADMLTDPERLRQDIATLAEREQPDVFIVDQLSYAATLALTCLDLPFVTFCPGHPTYIPTGDQLFGVPYAWPCEFDISGEQRAALRAIATETDRRFTRIFNETLATCAPAQPPIKSAFRVASP
ncbi:MAG: glycosyltransferase, partial [Anaerolineae bacterium]|nr:glycosyltransferase [Anaerolineae bacterium]